MVLRHSIKCNTCEEPLTLRISIGGNKEQKHNFNCPNCNDSLGIVLQLDQQNAVYGFKEYINCNFGESEGIIINLNPDFLIPSEDLHRDMAFPHLNQIHELGSKFHGRAPFDPSQEIITPYDRWLAVKPLWGLLNNKKYELIRKKLSLNESVTELEVSIQVFHKIYEVFQSLIFDIENTTMSKEFSQYGKRALQNHKKNFSDFINYSYKKLLSDDLKKLYDLFDAFFSANTDFNQVHISLKTGLSIDNSFSPSSTAINVTKKIYADCFELLANELVTISFIFNLSEGRHFNYFSDKKWTHYKKQHKKFLLDYIRSEPELLKIESLLLNRVRNASSHQSMAWRPEDRTFVCTDRDKTFEISYLDYLILCLRSINYLAAINTWKMTLIYMNHKRAF